jgi:transketolase
MSKLTADTIRLLAADMVQKANSGHPGLPMGMADCATVLWTQFLKYNPSDPDWPNRDRFVLSGGHGSALLYVLLHLAGYDMSLEDLKEFRQWGSRTPGHPECEIPGVETTTGPLGQGIANAVGMAMAAKIAKDKWNDKLFGDHYVYCFCGDGDMMEGVSHEASSIAGHLALNNIICFYDSNHITIDGKTDITFSENVAQRYEAYGWQVQTIDGHDHDQIAAAIKGAQKETGKPSLIIAQTHIAFGSPNKQDTSASHGAPLGEDEIRLTKKVFGFPEDKQFYIPDGVKEEFAGHVNNVIPIYEQWQKDLETWKNDEPFAFEEYDKQINKIFPEDISSELIENLSGKDGATRGHSYNILQMLADMIPGLIGGSADLAGSNKTTLKQYSAISGHDFNGKNVHYGIREFVMGAIMNGMALYGSGLIPFGGTFLVFSDYMRSAIRMSALIRQQVIYVFTHDSIFVGEDGPTHQPVEQIMSLRLIPGLQVIRPADEIETAEAWLAALAYKEGPTALVLTRQNLPNIHKESIKDFNKGAFVVLDPEQAPEAVICASGSEVSISMQAAEKLNSEGYKIRVVSIPSLEIFLKQEQRYRERIIPSDDMPVISVEAGRTFGWSELGRNPMLHIGIDHFGASAPYKVLGEKFGFTADAVYDKVKKWLTEQRGN